MNVRKRYQENRSRGWGDAVREIGPGGVLGKTPEELGRFTLLLGAPGDRYGGGRGGGNGRIRKT